MANPIYKDGLYYKRVGLDLVVLGSGGSVELCVDELGGFRYYLNGLLHREDGPALITGDGQYREWYLKGKQIHPVWLETRKMK